MGARPSLPGVPHQIIVYDGQPHAFVTDMEAIRRGGAPGQAGVHFLEQTLKRASNGGSLPGYVRRIALDCVVPSKPEDVLHVGNHLHAWLPNR